MQNTIELELLRQKEYLSILDWLKKELKTYLKEKEINHLLLRYIFNKNITKTSDDDSVFITSESKLAINQLVDDFRYSKVNKDGFTFSINLEEKLKKASDIIKNSKTENDSEVVLIDNRLIYTNINIQDISNLAERFPEYINYAFALNIRYNYLKLHNHGLARKYQNMGYKKNQATEAFGTAFNNYFTEYCSAFPDLESVFNSKGSFFQQKEWKTFEVFLNPPFDISLMNMTMKFIYDFCKNNKQKHRFIFTIPNWPDYPELTELKNSEWTTHFKIHKKGSLSFLDYMTGKSIYPCDVAEVILEN